MVDLLHCREYYTGFFRCGRNFSLLEAGVDKNRRRWTKSTGGELAQVSGVANTWYFLVKYIIPIFIFVIFLSSIGLLAF